MSRYSSGVGGKGKIDFNPNAPSITGNKPGKTPGTFTTPGNKNGKGKGGSAATTDNDKKDTLENIGKALNQLSSTAAKFGGKGSDLDISATNVRSGASHGAKSIDPWRSFSTESGSPNDNN